MPAGSTPIRRVSSKGLKSVKRPMALEPPPTQAMTASGRSPFSASANWARASSPITFWNSRTIVGKG